MSTPPDDYKDLLNSLTAPMWKVEPVDLQRIAKEAAAALTSLVQERDALVEDLAEMTERWQIVCGNLDRCKAALQERGPSPEDDARAAYRDDLSRERGG